MKAETRHYCFLRISGDNIEEIFFVDDQSFNRNYFVHYQPDSRDAEAGKNGRPSNSESGSLSTVGSDRGLNEKAKNWT